MLLTEILITLHQEKFLSSRFLAILFETQAFFLNFSNSEFFSPKKLNSRFFKNPDYFKSFCCKKITIRL